MSCQLLMEIDSSFIAGAVGYEHSSFLPIGPLVDSWWQPLMPEDWILMSVPKN